MQVWPLERPGYVHLARQCCMVAHAYFIAYCSHITLFIDLSIGGPLYGGGPWL